jgi:uncharacterized protein
MTLQQFFSEYQEVALGFSGGVDSSYLLYVALRFAKRVQAYYVKTAFQPQFELDDARRLAEQLDTTITVVPVSVLNIPHVAENPENRCYYCKTAIFSTIAGQAAADGFSVILDGTNASDRVADRPGMRALKELQVYSPLRDCGLTKQRIRQLSREAGLFTWNKPAYACLATRIPTGRHIDADTLQRVEQAEGNLFSLGFSDFRVRVLGSAAQLQFVSGQLAEAFTRREEIEKSLAAYFSDILLDLKPRKEEPFI